jgi:pSer/pThr/pTyr-binding forkhead associated (FHA) protein
VDRPTPRPAGAAWEPAGWSSQPAYAPVAAGQPEGATMLLSQRPTAVFAWLVVMDGPEKGRIHQLRPEVTTVGRAAGANDVVIADDAASGQHLKIKREHEEGAEDQFILFDLASSNGTYAGDKASYRAPASRVYRHALHDGDYLLVGETTLVFKQV